MNLAKLRKVLLLNLRLAKTRVWAYDSAYERVEILFKILIHNVLICLTHMFPALARNILRSRFPVRVMIETASFCNGNCIICPQGKSSGDYPQGKMEWELYAKIIDECSKFKVSALHLYLTNEPLLDEDIIEHIKYARERMPGTKIVLSTNCSMLAPDKTRELLHYVDSFVFSVFGINKEDYAKMMPGLDYNTTIANIEYFVKFKKENRLGNEVFVRNIIGGESVLEKGSFEKLRKIFDFWKEKGLVCKHDLFTTRAGNMPASQNECKGPARNSRLKGCWFHNSPLKYLHIAFNGDAVLCCMDCKGEVKLGNLKKQNIYEIWNSKFYDAIRDRIYLDKGESGNDSFLCTRCINPYFNPSNYGQF